MMFIALISLMSSISISRALEVGQIQYLQGDAFPWIAALMDRSNQISCNANVITNFVSVTACECLAIRPIDSGEPLEVRDGSEERYSLLGGTNVRSSDVDPNYLAKPISFHIHQKCNFTIISQRMKWVYNYGVIMHHPFVFHVGVRLEPMPTWSIDPDKVERRFKELVAAGQQCFIVGWTATLDTAVRIRVAMSEGLNCSRYSCQATRTGHGMCSTTAVTCAGNVSGSNGIQPFCQLEAGMPLICGPTADTYAITESSVCGFESVSYLWKVSGILDWIDSFVKEDTSVVSRNETHRGYLEHQGTLLPDSSQRGCLRFHSSILLSFFTFITLY